MIYVSLLTETCRSNLLSFPSIFVLRSLPLLEAGGDCQHELLLEDYNLVEVLTDSSTSRRSFLVKTLPCFLLTNCMFLSILLLSGDKRLHFLAVLRVAVMMHSDYGVIFIWTLKHSFAVQQIVGETVKLWHFQKATAVADQSEPT